MDQKSRKSIYQVTMITEAGERSESPVYKEEAAARHFYNKMFDHYKVVLFCTTTPTVTKGQIDLDLY